MHLLRLQEGRLLSESLAQPASQPGFSLASRILAGASQAGFRAFPFLSVLIHYLAETQREGSVVTIHLSLLQKSIEGLSGINSAAGQLVKWALTRGVYCGSSNW